MELSTPENTAGVVVLYNPSPEVKENILSYLDAVAELFVVLNSAHVPDPLYTFLKAQPKVTLLENRQNKGLAFALNQGAGKALATGYRWLLTMDQDSKAAPTMLATMQEAIREHAAAPIGLVSPVHVDKHAALTSVPQAAVTETKIAMTSGNLLNLQAYQKVGPFETKLFIDYIDHEYCLRLQSQGYKVLQSNKSILYHNLGAVKVHRLLHVQVATTHHSPERRYYITRNRLYVMHKYRKQFPEYYKAEWKHLLVDFARILLFEENKGQKLKFILKGYQDYRAGAFFPLTSK
ncbi:glycosyltransferase family 2 protein [Rufibacter psychrotolerans]|uniref:glycosyltransferase family 2 protein n=1 Tax=Rufibacter psychrotolerans TaxID=2812556 RepID=UPI001967ED9E|nr:glycosyltransferase family 2 protein [Rufibacter sp. SYSU D00308]